MPYFTRVGPGLPTISSSEDDVCFPIVVKCSEKATAEIIHDKQASFFSLHSSSLVSDLLLCRAAKSTILNSVLPGSPVYPVWHVHSMCGYITFDYDNDILPLCGNSNRGYCKFRRVDTFGEAVAFLLAKGNSGRLRMLGISKKSSSKSSESSHHADNMPNAVLPSNVSTLTDSPRVTRRCRTCKKPMRGHPKGQCAQLLLNAVTDDIAKMTIVPSGGSLAKPLEGALTLQAETDTEDTHPLTPHVFTLSSPDIVEVKDFLAMKQIPVRIAVVYRPHSDDGWLVIGGSAEEVQDLTNLLQTKPDESTKRGYGLVHLGSAAMIGMISTWAGLAYV
ncbi:hypothetical protein SCP_0300670 [Sparassis crispa]|uniref:Uncharacterized protein n=1 Tax=Sparassis crispa TaxID=139825 RepID=A0A401GDU3_9APHY|nr:hypothetical protein SCP_0300670 [Sparassis crispa]GBE80352.1 hypothetical protein SCP_0300670 [Sparassis crispa]